MHRNRQATVALLVATSPMPPMLLHGPAFV